MRILMVAGIASLALLAGCKSDEEILKEARTAGLERCKSQAKAQPTAPGIDTDRFCECLVEKSMAGRSVKDLENMKEAEQKSVGEKAGSECIMQQLPAGGAAAGQSVPAETGAETVEEAADAAE